MKKTLAAIALSLILQYAFGQKENAIIVESPNKDVEATISLTNNVVRLTVSKNNELVLRDSPLGLIMDGNNTGVNVILAGPATKKTIDEKYSLFGNHTQAINNCKEVSIPLNSKGIVYRLLIRAYDDGVAIRYIIQANKKMKIEGDNTAFPIPSSAQCYWAYNLGGGEGLHNISSFAEMPDNKTFMAPLTIKSGSFYLSFSEADCRRFPDLSWIKTGNLLKANFTTTPKGWEVDAGIITSPWRLAIIANSLTQLVNSDLIMNLCEPPNTTFDFSWVKPGRVMWQWWSVGDPIFEDQKNWYDAAARLTWEYYLIDAGWSKWSQPGKDQWQCLKEAIDYGNSKGVKSIVWVHSKEIPSRDAIRTYLLKVKQAGAVGIKIDYIKPATPVIMQWYETALEETCNLQLLCDFHGCVKPTGLRRTWPHELTREGVRGNEYQMTRYNRVAPKSQDVLNPFTRFIAGPADFTPVIFSEKELNGFTWTHELAQAVVFLSPLTHFADAYYCYLNNPAEDILRDFPVTWDETIVLPCTEIGKVAAFARRKGNEWWVGIMNGEQTNNISFDLNFLNSSALATILSDRNDAINAFVREEKMVKRSDKINLQLAPGGGYFMRMKLINNVNAQIKQVIVDSISAKPSIDPASYQEIRGGLTNSYLQFSRKKTGRVAFLGGSITAMSGWREKVCKYLTTRFPETKFDFIHAGIPSTGSTPGAFRLATDVLAKGKIDLLFEEAAVNDNGQTAEADIRGMEGIVRHALKANPFMDIVLMYFVDPGKIRDYNTGKTPLVIESHNKVAIHYNLPSLNLAKEVTDRIKAGEFTWGKDFKNLHPSPFGQELYSKSIRSLLESGWKQAEVHKGRVRHAIPTQIDKYSYTSGKYEDIHKTKDRNGWVINEKWAPTDGITTRKGFVDVPMLISEQPGSTITYKFKGTATGICTVTGPDAGIIEYSIDGGEFRSRDLFNTNWSSRLYLNQYLVFGDTLSPSKHELKIRISEMKNEKSTGHACRIVHLLINEAK
ncbi:MAG: glycoside hydrolase family 97 catalytic domain-containing protein [Prolixibacteraceae bacterium]|jgi:alpha-glucosidase|nr:glycoside hydrolase family 97 catalytic domain-containing protein [Prolixibacteraceae bacterium]